MNNKGDFSPGDSEELIANLKSGKPSEFEQLRSALNLLAHVNELPPTSVPPMLPSEVRQPLPLLPGKSSRPRRTIVTSIMIAGLFASASLAAAAVTGIGPAAIVNAGHQAAKFVKGVVGGVAHVVTGSPTDVTQNQAASPSIPLTTPLNPSPTLAPSTTDESNQLDAEHLTTIIPALASLFPPASTESSSHENDSQKPNSSHETQGPNVDDSSPVTSDGEKEQSNSEDKSLPSPLPSTRITQDASEQESSASTPAPSVSPSSEPSSEPTSEQPLETPSPSPSPSPSPTDQPSEDD